ncbi:hypothetical protein O0I10_004168 [Lichtheimia ornata]|uniref:Alpha/beta hydrolase fold-3 domain-containing protein n=1 Tax=Lichtheimia ornata TaxID=688661 RepID=A0AAD7V8N0_9FUNG|nr:uncharacterized protein O0I10_004168 [Lichtheimia ornata]KAJ8659942.1 hypothetical protein O0I10_004168 [Lichtheimia ornata]
MTRAIPIHPAYVDSVKARDAAPLLHQIEDFEAFNKVVDAHCATFKVPEVIEEDRKVEFNGKTLDLTLLRPLGTEKEVLPVIIFYHGGAWVMGSKYTTGKIIRDLCIKNHAAIVFPNYALAPKVKFPGIHEECYSALEWVLAHGKDSLLDTSKIATCGDSAGGNLAIAIPLMAKQRGLPKDTIKAQIPLYPVTTDTREHSPSYQELSNGQYILTHDEIRFASKVYHYDDGSNGGDEKWIYPLRASVDDLRDLPPALVITAEADVLCDEGEEYARKLVEADVKTAAVRMIGAVHGYITLSQVDTPVYLQTLAMIKYHLDEAFGKL